MSDGAECYERYVNGDDDALKELVEMYSDGLLLFINGMIHNINDSEDVLSETFLELILKKNRFRRESDFKTYLYRIGRNKSVDFVRKRERYNRKKLLGSEESLTDDESVINAVINNEKNARLYKAMDSIPGQYREVLHLLFIEGMSLDEVSIILKKNKKQTENLEYRAKKALKQILKNDECFSERDNIDENISAKD